MQSGRSIAKGGDGEPSSRPSGLPPVQGPARGAAWVVGVIAIAVLSLHAASFLPFLSDDALISLRDAQRLLDGFGLTWTEGPPVEGYSNLLWVLGCALGGALGLDLVDAARGLGARGAARS